MPGSIRVALALLAGCGIAAVATIAGAAEPETGSRSRSIDAVEEIDVGLAIGEPAPRFTLADQQGAGRAFDSLLSRGKLAIVFYRSADW